MSSTAGSATVDATGEYVYEDTRGCSTFMVGVDAASTNGALVNIQGLHDAGDFFPIAVGRDYVFRLNNVGIRKVFVKGDGGNSDIIFGVVAKT